MGCSTNSIKIVPEINETSFKCFYEIKDNEETQIINNKLENFINKEIESNIKIFI